ncbi:MAG: hypothetical protein HQ490_03095 [Lutibacter sp.]|nr:hypothetical protein [Lutibacter sp.]
MKSLEEFFSNNSYRKEIYSEEGIFMIDKNNLYQVTYLDGEITKFPNYIHDINIITDKTEETKKIVNQVPFTNIVLDLETRHYVLNKQSNFKLVIDFIINDNKTEPYNFYFDIPNIIDINSPLFKEDLNVFLFHLN